MTKTRIASLTGTLIALVLCAASYGWADSAQYIRQTIVNGSDQPANDLHLVFTEDITDAKLKPKTQPPGRDADGVIPSSNRRVADWAPPDSFGTVSGGGVAYVDYEYYGYRPLIDEANSAWTKDGEDLPNFKKQGRPMHISTIMLDENIYSSARIENLSDVMQSYYVELYGGNDLLNFNLDLYFIPTGTLQGAFSFDLDPGQSKDLIFEPSLPHTYLLAIGEGWATGGDPYLDGYSLCAAAVPEPGTFLLLGTGALLILGLARRRSTRVLRGE